MYCFRICGGVLRMRDDGGMERLGVGRSGVVAVATGGVWGESATNSYWQVSAGSGCFYVVLVALCSGCKGWALVKPDPRKA
jgi:hypothetical protein